MQKQRGKFEFDHNVAGAATTAAVTGDETRSYKKLNKINKGLLLFFVWLRVRSVFSSDKFRQLKQSQIISLKSPEVPSQIPPPALSPSLFKARGSSRARAKRISY